MPIFCKKLVLGLDYREKLTSLFFFVYSFKVLLVPVALLLLALLLNSHRKVQARPTDSSTFFIRNLNENSHSRNIAQNSTKKTAVLKPRQKDGAGSANGIDMQPTRHSIIERATDNQEESLTADGAGLTRTSFPSSVNKNPCIKRFRYRIIFNYFFAIPVCKGHQGCFEVIKIVNFGKGITYAIPTNCQRVNKQ